MKLCGLESVSIWEDLVERKECDQNDLNSLFSFKTCAILFVLRDLEYMHMSRVYVYIYSLPPFKIKLFDK